MSIEHLKRIRESEEQAEKIRRDGLAGSKRIVEMATEETAALLDQANAEAEAMYAELIEKTTKEAQTDYEKTMRRARWECDMLLEGKEERVKDAVSIIVRKVVSEWPS